MDTARAKSALQSEGDACHSTRSPDTCTDVESELRPDSVRQQDCSGVPPKRRGDQVSGTNGFDSSNIESNRLAPNLFQHPLYTGQVQQSGRSLIQASTSSGMAPTTGRSRASIQEMGNSGNRLVCLGESSRGLQLCNLGRQRSQGACLRCLQFSMELHTSVGISSSLPGSQGVGTSKQLQRGVPASSTTMGEGVLESRSQIESSRDSNRPQEPERESNRHINGSATSEPARPDTRSLEMWGWTEGLSGWNLNQVSLLKSSWRQSTLRTYKPAWDRWLSWSRSKNIDFKNPSGAQLAQFLADLYLIHGLSYNTILLHKSVVSTLCHADISSQLSSHVLVKHILKAISLKKPKFKKSPIWDVDKLLNFLSNYSIDENNIYQTSRHTAILLLLCSGRRIHDLTLLRVDSEYCIRSDDYIILWPEFGSKTDDSNYRQSGWKLTTNKENTRLDPVFWIEKMTSLLDDRRKTAKTPHLFTTIRGPAKPASRTVIAGWIKHLFKEADIQYTPGSVRSAVASKNWLNLPLDEILARGNWRSANTFKRFYRREIMRRHDSTNVAQSFNPID